MAVWTMPACYIISLRWVINHLKRLWGCTALPQRDEVNTPSCSRGSPPASDIPNNQAYSVKLGSPYTSLSVYVGNSSLAKTCHGRKTEVINSGEGWHLVETGFLLHTVESNCRWQTGGSSPARVLNKLQVAVIVPPVHTGPSNLLCKTAF